MPLQDQGSEDGEDTWAGRWLAFGPVQTGHETLGPHPMVLDTWSRANKSFEQDQMSCKGGLHLF